MTQINSVFSEIDPIAERRRALSKVYALLLRLAEETESKKHSLENPDIANEKISEPVLKVETQSTEQV